MKKLMPLFVASLMLHACGDKKTTQPSSVTVDLRTYHETDCTLADQMKASGEEIFSEMDTMCCEMTMTIPVVSTGDQRISDMMNGMILQRFCRAEEGELPCVTVEDIKREFHNASKEFGYSITISSEVLYNNKGLLSIGHSYEDFAFGAAHPMTGYSTSNFDVKTGKQIRLMDIFTEAGLKNLHKLANEARDSEYPMAQADAETPGAPDFSAEEEIDLPEDFCLNENGITLYYDMYEAGPGSDGNIVLEIPMEKIKGDFRSDGPGVNF